MSPRLGGLEREKERDHHAVSPSLSGLERERPPRCES